MVCDGDADVGGRMVLRSLAESAGGCDSCYCLQLETEVSLEAESSVASAEASENSESMNIQLLIHKVLCFITGYALNKLD